MAALGADWWPTGSIPHTDARGVSAHGRIPCCAAPKTRLHTRGAQRGMRGIAAAAGQGRERHTQGAKQLKGHMRSSAVMHGDCMQSPSLPRAAAHTLPKGSVALPAGPA